MTEVLNCNTDLLPKAQELKELEPEVQELKELSGWGQRNSKSVPDDKHV